MCFSRADSFARGRVPLHTCGQAVYSDPALQLPWYALLGNHDYVQNPQAQIQYSQQRLDARWNMPDTNYTQAFAVASGVTLQVRACMRVAPP